MKRIIYILPLISIFMSACSDDEESINLCGCDIDQYCVDGKCYDTDANVVPAPEE